MEQSLENVLKNRIEQHGPMSFIDFMAACLYEPGQGYYTSPGRKVGAAGDFYTSISVHAAFGRVLAREVTAMWHSLHCPSHFTLMEVGAGHGRLACDILDYLAECQPDCYQTLSLILVDQEPTLIEAQQTTLKAHSNKVTSMTPEQARSQSFVGVLYSNELIDAMPVHRVIMTSQGLKEIYVGHDGNQFIDLLQEPSTPRLTEYLDSYAIPLHPGQEAEISLAAIDWLNDMYHVLTAGFIMTIDYGWAKAQLYAPERKLGTLLCYHQHTVEDNPYIRIGQQDITTHINFSALLERGEELGLETIWFGDQSRFLLNAGILEELEAMEASGAPEKERLKFRLALKRLIMPEGGMGDTFRVLVQAKAVEKPLLRCQQGLTS